MTLYAYISKTACTKCGNDDISDQFHRAASSEFGNGPDCNYGDVCNFSRVEHIRRYCRRCSHQWACAPLDGKTTDALSGVSETHRTTEGK